MTRLIAAAAVASIAGAMYLTTGWGPLLSVAITATVLVATAPALSGGDEP